MRKCPIISCVVIILSPAKWHLPSVISEFCFISLDKQFCEGNNRIFSITLVHSFFNIPQLLLSTYYVSSALIGTKKTMGNKVNEVFFLIRFILQCLFALFLAGLEFYISVLSFFMCIKSFSYSKAYSLMEFKDLWWRSLPYVWMCVLQ